MRTLSHAPTAASSHGIDLAPMLDFAVNLLIFFIVTAVFVKQAGLEVGRPSGVELTTDTPSKSFVIDADAVVANPEAPMGVIVGVADAIRLGGIDNITFTTTVRTVPQ